MDKHVARVGVGKHAVAVTTNLAWLPNGPAEAPEHANANIKSGLSALQSDDQRVSGHIPATFESRRHAGIAPDRS